MKLKKIFLTGMVGVLSLSFSTSLFAFTPSNFNFSKITKASLPSASIIQEKINEIRQNSPIDCSYIGTNGNAVSLNSFLEQFLNMDKLPDFQSPIIKEEQPVETPEAPADEEEVAETPEAPADEEEVAETPEAPADEEEVAETPEVPADEEEVTETPEVPASEETETPDAPVATPNEPAKETEKEEIPTQQAPVTDTVTAYENEVLVLVNQERANHGLSPLKMNEKLREIAREKSRDMSVNGYFSHTSPTYGSPFDMLKQFGISYRRAAENIAYGYTSPEAVVNGWMNSEGHRANILNGALTDIGVGYYASGHYWTQLFITP